MKRTSFTLAFILFLIFISPAAGAQPNLSLEARAGFDGFYKTDTWTPIQVTITNQGAGLQTALRLRDNNAGFDISNAMYVYPLDLPGQSRKQITLYAPLRGQPRVEVEVIASDGSHLLATKANSMALEKQALLVGVVAGDASLLNGLAGLKTVDNERIAVAHLRPNDLPGNPLAWSSLDILVFNDVDTTLLTTAQREALSNWVQSGGRLVIGGGPNAAQTIAGLKPLLPLTEVSLQTLPHPLAGLQRFAAVTGDDRGPYVAAIPINPDGRNLAQEGNLPLIIGASYGLGQVYYLALDLGLAPLDRLAVEPQFFPRLIGPLQSRSRFIDNFDHYRMRDSLALIPGQTLPSPGKLTLYLVMYVLIIGPANYFVLRRLKRREWAWVTIPAIILVFSGYGYFSGFRLRGGQPLLHQITVVQADMAAPLSKVDTFIGVYSPARAAYTLDIGESVLAESLGSFGVNSELTVTAGSSTRIENLRSDIGSMPTLVAHSYATAPPIVANLRYDKAGRRLSGTITNNTGQSLSNALLVMNDQLLQLGELPAGSKKVDGVTTDFYYLNNTYEFDQLNDPAQAVRLASQNTAVQALFNFDYSANAGLNGLYLVGWQEGSSIPVTLVNSDSDQISETMLVIGLPFF